MLIESLCVPDSFCFISHNLYLWVRLAQSPKLVCSAARIHTRLSDIRPHPWNYYTVLKVL